jgi:hypothetical protein
MRMSLENTVRNVSTVSSVHDGGHEPDSEQHSLGLASAACDDSRRVGSRPTLQGLGAAADDADGADVKAPFG